MTDIISIFNNQLNIDNFPIHLLINSLDTNSDKNNVNNVNISITTAIYLLKEHMLCKTIFINDLLQYNITDFHKLVLTNYLTDLYSYINILSYFITVYQN